MNNLVKFLTGGLVFGSCVGRIFANGFSLLDQDAFATARGEAVVATADNASAICYNPAGIAQLDGSNLRGGIYGIYLNPSYQPTATAPNSGHTYYSSDHLAAVPQGFFTHTFDGTPFSVGLGVYAPFGGSMNWPQDTGFRTVATQGYLNYLSINPVVAMKLAPGLFVAAGVMANYVELNMEQGLSASQQPPNFFKFTGHGWSVNYNAGALWQPIKQLSIGASLRGAAQVDLEGHTSFEDSPFIKDQSLPAHMDLTFPLTAVGGISYRPTPKWNMEFDANCTEWSSFGTTTLYQEGNVPLGFQQNVPVNLNWRNSWIYEFGITRYFDSGWHLSGGYVFNQNSVPNENYSPLAADLDRHFFSIGAGYKGKVFNFDLAYQFGYGPEHTVTGSTPSSVPGQFGNQSADGKYGFISNALIVSAGIHF
jgi:long-chain fatty acid transport protein